MNLKASGIISLTVTPVAFNLALFVTLIRKVISSPT